MDIVLWLGSALGAVIGLLHAGYIYRGRLQRSANDRIMAVYRGLWAFALWVLFGSYLLVLWVVGVIAYAAVRAVPGLRSV
jgi:hypothetical protein